MTALCIYHGNCQDGFAAAWAVRFALGDIEFHPGVYQSEPPDVSDRDVIMVDFSYKRAVLEQMAAVASSLLVLDHHKSAAEDLAFEPAAPPNWREHWERLGGILRYRCALFDMNRSGAGLAWDYFHPGEPRPSLIDTIEDRDLWRFKLPHTRVITEGLFSYPYDFDVWDDLMDEDRLEILMLEGRGIERKHLKDVAELVSVTRRELVIGGITMPVASLPYTLTSDAGHLMATEHPAKMAACYWDTAEGRVFSLRSTDDGPDVSAIAKAYGGGGHAHAARFRMPIGWEGDRPNAEI